MGVTTTGQEPLAPGGNIALRLDAQQAFARFVEDIEHFATFDPDIAWVQESLMARFRELPEEDVLRVTALLWPGLKSRMVPDICPPHWPWPWPPYLPGRSVFPWHNTSTGGSVPRPLINLRHGLIEGQALRRTVETQLNSGALTADSLRKTAQQIREWERSSESARTREFDEAREEVRRITTEGVERKLLVAFASGFVAGAIVAGVGMIVL